MRAGDGAESATPLARGRRYEYLPYSHRQGAFCIRHRKSTHHGGKTHDHVHEPRRSTHEYTLYDSTPIERAVQNNCTKSETEETESAVSTSHRHTHTIINHESILYSSTPTNGTRHP